MTSDQTPTQSPTAMSTDKHDPEFYMGTAFPPGTVWEQLAKEAVEDNNPVAAAALALRATLKGLRQNTEERP